MNPEKLTQKELSTLLNRTDRTVRELEPKGLPGHGEGKQKFYRWSEVEPWWWEYRISLLGAKKEGMKGVPDRMVSEARKLAAEAEMAEMRANTMRGQLLDADEVEAEWSKIHAYVRGRLLSMSGTLAPQLVDGMTVAERKTIIDDCLFLVLEALSRGEGLDG